MQHGQDHIGSLLQGAPEQRVAVSHAGRQTGDQKAAQRQGQAPEVHSNDGGRRAENVAQHHAHQPKEVALSVGEGAQSEHHARHHHERIHILLAALFCAGAGTTLPGHHQRPQDPWQSVSVAGICEQFAESDYLCHIESRFSQTISSYFIFSVW